MKRISSVLWAAALCLALAACGGEAESPAVNRPTDNVVTETAVNDTTVLIETRADREVSRFWLYDTAADQAEQLPAAPYELALEEVVNEDYFVFRATGRNSESARLDFPHLVDCYRTGTGEFETRSRELVFPLTESVQGGKPGTGAMDTAMTAMAFSLDGVSIAFGPNPEAENSAGYYADYVDIPLTTVSYDEAAGVLLLDLDDCVLPEDLVLQSPEQNFYIESCTAEQTDIGVKVLLALSPDAGAYTISQAKAPDGTPCLTLTLTAGDQ